MDSWNCLMWLNVSCGVHVFMQSERKTKSIKIKVHFDAFSVCRRRSHYNRKFHQNWKMSEPYSSFSLFGAMASVAAFILFPFEIIFDEKPSIAQYTLSLAYTQNVRIALEPTNKCSQRS